MPAKKVTVSTIKYVVHTPTMRSEGNGTLKELLPILICGLSKPEEREQVIAEMQKIHGDMLRRKKEADERALRG